MSRASKTIIAAVVAMGSAVAARAADAPAVAAQDKAEKTIAFLDQKAANSGSFTFDYGVPTSPALTLTGLSAEKLNTSTSLKPFVMAIPDLFKEGGPTSLAFDASLGQLTVPERENRYSTYVAPENWSRRLAYRTRLGAVVDKGKSAASDAAASKLGIGVSMSVLDDSDPLMAGNRMWEACVFDNIGQLADNVAAPEGNARSAVLRARNSIVAMRLRMMAAGPRQITEPIVQDISAIEIAWRDLPGASPPPSPAPNYTSVAAFDAWLAQADAALVAPPAAAARPDPAAASRGEILKNCAKEASEKAQLSQDLDIGAGAVWSGDNGRIAHLRKGSTVVWAAYRLPLTTLSRPMSGEAPSGSLLTNVMIGARARFAWDDTLATGDAATPNVRADVSDLWVGLEHLTKKTRVAAQYGWFDADTKRAQDSAFQRSSRRWLVSGAYNLEALLEGAWLTFSYGKSESTLDKFDDKVALVSVTFAPPTLSSMFKDK